MLNYTAARVIPLIDHTDLASDEAGKITSTSESVEKLCNDARKWGVAAVCVWPDFVKQARQKLEGSDVKVATVVNFPRGGMDSSAVADEISEALDFGAQEIDLVFPYESWLSGEVDKKAAAVQLVKDSVGACRARDVPLKVILETSKFQDEYDLLREAAREVLKAGADFLKTSTGKPDKDTDNAADPATARILLEAIKEFNGKGQNGGRSPGVKISGGVRTVADAVKYLLLADEILGDGWANPRTFRLGASGLLSAAEAHARDRIDVDNLSDRAYDRIKTVYEKAWQYFSLHADQRTKMFQFYILAVGAILTAIGALSQLPSDPNGVSDVEETAALPPDVLIFIFIGVLALSIVSIVFLLLDVRNAHLVGIAEKTLSILEERYFFWPEAPYATHRGTRIQIAGLVGFEQRSQCHARPWTEVFKHKVGIRGTQLAVLLFCLIGLILVSNSLATDGSWIWYSVLLVVFMVSAVAVAVVGVLRYSAEMNKAIGAYISNLPLW